MEVQTRSDSHTGLYPGLHNFDSVEDAYNAWIKDSNIWKISWYHNDKYHRFRPITKKSIINEWGSRSIIKIRQMSQDFIDANMEQLFWVDQLTIPEVSVYEEIMEAKLHKRLKNPNIIIPYLDMRKEDRKEEDMARCIVGVYTDSHFRVKYIDMA